MHRRTLLLSLAASGGLLLACAGGATPEEEVAAVAEPEPEAEAASPALDRVLGRGTLVVAMDLGENGAGTPPMYLPDAAGKPDGFDYEVAKWVALAVGVPDVKLVHGKYAELPEMLRASKEIDVVISGYAPTDDPGLAWSVSYLDYGLALMVPGDSPVRRLEDLAGRTVGVFADPAARAEVQRLVPDAGALVEMQDGYIEALAAGKMDGFVYDYPYAAAELRAWVAANTGKEAPRFARYNLNEMHYAVAVRDTEPELLDKVNEGIVRFTGSDKYGEAIRRFLSGGATVAASAAPKSGAPQKMVTVQKGDTLSVIAGRELGDAGRWKDIWQANRDRLASPHLIEVGDQLALP